MKAWWKVRVLREARVGLNKVKKDKHWLGRAGEQRSHLS